MKFFNSNISQIRLQEIKSKTSSNIEFRKFTSIYCCVCKLGFSFTGEKDISAVHLTLMNKNIVQIDNYIYFTLHPVCRELFLLTPQLYI